MAGEIATAYVVIKPRLEGFQQEATAGINRSLQQVQANTRQVSRAADDGSRSVGRFNRGIIAANASAIGFGRALTFASTAFLGGAGLGALIRTATHEFSEMTRTAATTGALLRSTGGVAHVTATQVQELSTALLNQTGVDDEVIASGANVLLTFRRVRNELGEGNDIFTRAVNLSLDLSSVFRTDVAGAAVQLGKALEDPVRGVQALRRSGISFTQEQTKLIKSLVDTGQTLRVQRLILGEVERQVGGTAKAIGQTLPGQLNILRERAVNALGEYARRLSESEDAAQIARTGLAAFTAAFQGLESVVRAVGPPLADVARTAEEVISALDPKAILFAGAAYKALGIAISTTAGAQRLYTTAIATNTASQAASAAETAHTAGLTEAYERAIAASAYSTDLASRAARRYRVRLIEGTRSTGQAASATGRYATGVQVTAHTTEVAGRAHQAYTKRIEAANTATATQAAATRAAATATAEEAAATNAAAASATRAAPASTALATSQGAVAETATAAAAAEARLAAAEVATTVATVRLTIAQRAAAVSSALFTRASALVGGTTGAVTIGIAALAFAYFKLNQAADNASGGIHGFERALSGLNDTLEQGQAAQDLITRRSDEAALARAKVRDAVRALSREEEQLAKSQAPAGSITRLALLDRVRAAQNALTLALRDSNRAQVLIEQAESRATANQQQRRAEINKTTDAIRHQFDELGKLPRIAQTDIPGLPGGDLPIGIRITRGGVSPEEQLRRLLEIVDKLRESSKFAEREVGKALATIARTTNALPTEHQVEVTIELAGRGRTASGILRELGIVDSRISDIEAVRTQNAVALRNLSADRNALLQEEFARLQQILKTERDRRDAVQEVVDKRKAENRAAQEALVSARQSFGSAKDAVADARQSLADANQSLADSIRSVNQAITDSVNSAKQNLRTFSDQIADAIERLSGDEGGAIVPTGELARRIRELREIVLSGQGGPATQRAAQELAARAAGQTPTGDADAARRKLEDLTEEFDTGRISAAQFNRGLTRILNQFGLSVRTFERRFGLRAGNELRATIAAARQQARAIAAGPQRPGAGFDQQIIRPIEAVREGRRQIADATRGVADATKGVHDAVVDMRTAGADLATATKNAALAAVRLSRVQDRLAVRQQRVDRAREALDKAPRPSLGLDNVDTLNVGRVGPMSVTTPRVTVNAGNVTVTGGAGGRAGGGSIPGMGTTDTVPAMLTPGEIVLNAGQQKRLRGLLGMGGGTPEQLFRAVRGFQTGGVARNRIPLGTHAQGTVWHSGPHTYRLRAPGVPGQPIIPLQKDISRFLHAKTGGLFSVVDAVAGDWWRKHWPAQQRFAHGGVARFQLGGAVDDPPGTPRRRRGFFRGGAPIPLGRGFRFGGFELPLWHSGPKAWRLDTRDGRHPLVPLRRDNNDFFQETGRGLGVLRMSALGKWWTGHWPSQAVFARGGVAGFQTGGVAGADAIERVRATRFKPSGLLVPGNIDLSHRPQVRNPDGSISTVRSISIGIDRGRTALIPTVVGHRIVSNAEAVRTYRATGQHLGIFSSVAAADRYADLIHVQQAKLIQTPTRNRIPLGVHADGQVWHSGPGRYRLRFPGVPGQPIIPMRKDISRWLLGKAGGLFPVADATAGEWWRKHWPAQQRFARGGVVGFQGGGPIVGEPRTDLTEIERVRSLRAAHHIPLGRVGGLDRYHGVRIWHSGRRRYRFDVGDRPLIPLIPDISDLPFMQAGSLFNPVAGIERALGRRPDRFTAAATAKWWKRNWPSQQFFQTGGVAGATPVEQLRSLRGAHRIPLGRNFPVGVRLWHSGPRRYRLEDADQSLVPLIPDIRDWLETQKGGFLDRFFGRTLSDAQRRLTAHWWRDNWPSQQLFQTGGVAEARRRRRPAPGGSDIIERARGLREAHRIPLGVLDDRGLAENILWHAGPRSYRLQIAKASSVARESAPDAPRIPLVPEITPWLDQWNDDFPGPNFGERPVKLVHLADWWRNHWPSQRLFGGGGVARFQTGGVVESADLRRRRRRPAPGGSDIIERARGLREAHHIPLGVLDDRGLAENILWHAGPRSYRLQIAKASSVARESAPDAPRIPLVPEITPWLDQWNDDFPGPNFGERPVKLVHLADWWRNHWPSQRLFGQGGIARFQTGGVATRRRRPAPGGSDIIERARGLREAHHIPLGVLDDRGLAENILWHAGPRSYRLQIAKASSLARESSPDAPRIPLVPEITPWLDQWNDDFPGPNFGERPVKLVHLADWWRNHWPSQRLFAQGGIARFQTGGVARRRRRPAPGGSDIIERARGLREAHHIPLGVLDDRGLAENILWHAGPRSYRLQIAKASSVARDSAPDAPRIPLIPEITPWLDQWNDDFPGPNFGERPVKLVHLADWWRDRWPSQRLFARGGVARFQTGGVGGSDIIERARRLREAHRLPLGRGFKQGNWDLPLWHAGPRSWRMDIQLARGRFGRLRGDPGDIHPRIPLRANNDDWIMRTLDDAKSVVPRLERVGYRQLAEWWKENWPSQSLFGQGGVARFQGGGVARLPLGRGFRSERGVSVPIWHSGPRRWRLDVLDAATRRVTHPLIPLRLDSDEWIRDRLRADGAGGRLARRRAFEAGEWWRENWPSQELFQQGGVAGATPVERLRSLRGARRIPLGRDFPVGVRLWHSGPRRYRINDDNQALIPLVPEIRGFLDDNRGSFLDRFFGHTLSDAQRQITAHWWRDNWPSQQLFARGGVARFQTGGVGGAAAIERARGLRQAHRLPLGRGFRKDGFDLPVWHSGAHVYRLDTVDEGDRLTHPVIPLRRDNDAWFHETGGLFSVDPALPFGLQPAVMAATADWWKDQWPSQRLFARGGIVRPQQFAGGGVVDAMGSLIGWGRSQAGRPFRRAEDLTVAQLQRAYSSLRAAGAGFAKFERQAFRFDPVDLPTREARHRDARATVLAAVDPRGWAETIRHPVRALEQMKDSYLTVLRDPRGSFAEHPYSTPLTVALPFLVGRKGVALSRAQRSARDVIVAQNKLNRRLVAEQQLREAAVAGSEGITVAGQGIPFPTAASIAARRAAEADVGEKALAAPRRIVRSALPLLARAAGRGERTVLVTDIVSSTQLAARLTAPQLAGLMRGFDFTIDRVARANRGHFVKSTGDGSVAVFRDRGDAIRAAVEVERALVTFPHPVRTVVAAGRATETAAATQLDVFGAAVNKAVRILTAARPGEIAASPAVLEGLRGVRRGTTRVVPLKGFGEGPLVPVLGEHLRQTPAAARRDRLAAEAGAQDLTIMFTKAAGDLGDHIALVRELAGRRGGTFIKEVPGGALLSFNQPATALRVADSIISAEPKAKVGLNRGPVQTLTRPFRTREIRGAAFDSAEDLLDANRPGSILYRTPGRSGAIRGAEAVPQVATTEVIRRMGSVWLPSLASMLNQVLTVAQLEIRRKAATSILGAPAKRSGLASGGLVPGFGSGDTVPALLTPGEWVLNARQQKHLAASFGTSADALRKHVFGFARGGVVRAARFQEGGVAHARHGFQIDNPSASLWAALSDGQDAQTGELRQVNTTLIGLRQDNQSEAARQRVVISELRGIRGDLRRTTAKGRTDRPIPGGKDIDQARGLVGIA